MNKREQTIYNIMRTSIKMFREQGFQNTSVRQIADAAGVSLGMVNHYFISKEYLGAQVLLLLSDYAGTRIPEYVQFEDDPILYDYVGTATLTYYLLDHGYKEFYLDSLRKDFFFNYLSTRPMRMIKALQKVYHFEASEDDQRLYSKYLPYMMEKTLMLKKEEGLFTTIDYAKVPYLIVQTALNHFIPESEVQAREPEGQRISRAICDTLEDYPPEEMLQEYVHKLDSALREASSESRDFMLRQVANMII